MAGCDGAHSRVRRELGLTFHGHPYPQDWLLADVLLDWDLREDATHAFFRPDGLPVIFFPMRGHRWRLTLPFAGDRAAQAPTLAEIQHLTDQRAPRPVTVSDPTWLANFRCHRRSASAYRRGRVLLAGDAVHIHTPAGGQGLNTGMLDAHNLGWKLALVASGRAPDALLDTYGTERRPVAEKVLELTHVLIRYGTMSHPVKRRVRDIVVPALGRTPVIQRRAARRISQIYVSYPRDRRPVKTAAGARPESASGCLTFRSASAARPPRCTASCAVAGTSWSFPRLTCTACWATPRCGATGQPWTSLLATSRNRSDLVATAAGRSCWSGPTATWRRGEGQAAWTRWRVICATFSGNRPPPRRAA